MRVVLDPNYAFLLAVALTGSADDLVTGDRKPGLLQRGSFGRTRIVSPGAFDRAFRPAPEVEPERYR